MMFKLRYLLVCEDWEPRYVQLHRGDLALAYLSAIRMIKQRTGIAVLDFLPLGDGAYLIWGQRKCQGYMAIKEQEPDGVKPG